jgi:hypothetical protein
MHVLCVCKEENVEKLSARAVKKRKEKNKPVPG